MNIGADFGSLSMRGLHQRFGNVHALDAIDLDVAAGEVLTLLGPSGCGKTTLMRIVAGLTTPTAGSVDVGGVSPAVARAHKLFGFVPQSPALLPWRTVVDNARLLQQVNRRADRYGAAAPPVDELLSHVGLSEFRDAYPHELSGGMQQRVALVRAFALGAPYLLMDEPFAALDEITRADMRHLLASLREPQQSTVLFVTHSIAEAVFLSDRVVVLSARPGRIVADVPIDLPRPRLPEVEDTPEFFGLTTRLRHELRSGMAS